MQNTASFKVSSSNHTLHSNEKSFAALSPQHSFVMPCQCESGDQIPSLVIYNRCGLDISFCLYVSSWTGYSAIHSVVDTTLLRTIKVPDESATPIRVGWRHLYRRYSSHSFPSVVLLSSSKDSEECFACPAIPLHGFTCKDIFLLPPSDTLQKR